MGVFLSSGGLSMFARLSLFGFRRSRLLARLRIAGSWLLFRGQNIRLEPRLLAFAML